MTRIFLTLIFCAMTLAAGAPTRGMRLVKILAIGNSFSRDAIEQNLYELAVADGQLCIVANLYIGGCSLERHVENIRGNKGAYEYRKIGFDGHMTETQNKSISAALAEEDWDYVSVQQASGLSGIYASYVGFLEELTNYVKARTPEKTKVVFHQTWSYSKNSDHGEYKNYGHNQEVMYLAIVEASRRAMKEAKIKTVVPCGTAIQFARSTELGDNMNRDGFHLSPLGQYIAACTWYEALFHRPVLGNSYAPESLSPLQKVIAQQAAHYAVKYPYKQPSE